MAKVNPSERFPELREFIKGNDQRVSDFCACLLPPGEATDAFVLEVFREFGELYRSQTPSEEVSPVQLRVLLFQTAWRHLSRAQSSAYFPFLTGRDTRVLRDLEEDLLDGPASNEKVRERLFQVDPELRAPLVLRDILGLDDESAAAILGLRWGVYRHRLHRGRLDFKEALKGTSAKTAGAAHA